MKKYLFLTASALMCASALNAQPVARNVDMIGAPVQAQNLGMTKSIAHGVAVQATQQEVNARKVARKEGEKLSAYYNRPAGTFYVGMSDGGGVYYTPALFTPLLKDVTFVNQSSGGATSYGWGYKVYNTDSKKYDSLTSTETNLVYRAEVIAVPNAPILTATRGAESEAYNMFSYHYDDKTQQQTKYDGIMVNCFDVEETALQIYNKDKAIYFSPKMFAAGNRKGGEDSKRGVVYYTGAKDADGGSEGCWFGHNSQGFNAMGVYVEKPENRYALNGVHVFYGNYAGKGESELTATVYKIAERGDSVVLGEELAKGTAKLDANSPSEGYLDFPFKEKIGDIEVDQPIDVNEPIMVVVTGYDNENIEKWTMFITTDDLDEGYGQHGYMMRAENGVPTFARGLDNFFKGVSFPSTAPSIFLDVDFPIIDFYYTDQSGKPVGKEVEMPVAGGEKKVDIFATKESDAWQLNEAPGWLTVTPSDSAATADGNYSMHSYVTLKAEALPEGVTGRSFSVEISVPGALQTIFVKQGEVASVGDVLASKKVQSVKYVNLAGVESAEPFDGLNIKVTTYTDGTTRATKMMK